MTSIPKLTVTYFGIGGRAEPIRLAAVIGKVPFTNKAVGRESWMKLKPTLPLGRVPALDIEQEGKPKETIIESSAIFTYVGKLGGLYPTDPIEAMKVDSILSVYNDFVHPLFVSMTGMVKGLISEVEWTEEDKLAMRKRILENEERGWPFFLKYFEGLLEKSSSGWLVGDKPTLADIMIGSIEGMMKSGFLDGIPTDTLDKYPLVQGLHAKIEGIPEVKAFRENYPIPYSDFDYKP